MTGAVLAQESGAAYCVRRNDMPPRLYYLGQIEPDAEISVERGSRVLNFAPHNM